MKQWIGLLIALVLFWGASIPSASALSCAPPRAPKEEMGYSELVFKGRLLSETNDKLKFHVLKAWKGDLNETVTLSQNYWTKFQVGEEYIIFVGTDNGKLRPMLCGNTGLASSFDEQTLGETIAIGTKSNVGLELAIAIISGVLIVAGIGITLVMQLNRK
ncbi:hypothetical protein [Paenibacillus sp. UNC451MF]|uniref:hypothetical protein n=1 Tax=Paenibacillus sp. UNC451MF TaxID=1449063 RepID=UPI00068AC055|nr:hypothetical protein [Paenibacillus sp. UNC451MF]